MSEPGQRASIEPAPEILELAARRGAARRAGEYAAADELRAQIEAAGWRVVDSGYDFRLEPAGPGAAVPSRLGEPDAALATVVVPVGGSDLQWLSEIVAGGSQVIVVGSPQAGTPEAVERVETIGPVRLVEAWNVGLRRSIGSVVILLDEGARVTSDVVTKAMRALADESVAVVGAAGLRSADVRRWEPAPAGDVDAVDGDWLCFRRADAAQRGPLDERFSTTNLLAVWWSLVLRDEGEDRTPRRAIALEVPSDRGGTDGAVAAPDRASRRDLYRIIGRFGRRYALLSKPVRPRKGSATAPRR